MRFILCRASGLLNCCQVSVLAVLFDNKGGFMSRTEPLKNSNHHNANIPQTKTDLLFRPFIFIDLSAGIGSAKFKVNLTARKVFLKIALLALLLSICPGRDAGAATTYQVLRMPGLTTAGTTFGWAVAHH